MKTYQIFTFVIVFLLINFSCAKTQKPESHLSNSQIQSIMAEIMQMTDTWGRDNNNKDVSASKKMWLNSSELRFAENGVFFPSYDSIVNFISTTYAQCDTMKFEWVKREVQPLTEDIACFSAIFNFNRKFKDGSNWKGTNTFTATFIKREDSWRIINGQESTKPESQD